MKTLSPTSKETLLATGWTLIPSTLHSKDQLASQTLMLAHQIGTPVCTRAKKVIEELSPTLPQDARRPSLSRKHGLDEFPFHVDTAHWTVPARFVILTCVSNEDDTAPTFIADTAEISLSNSERQLAGSANFLVKNGRNSFYSAIFGHGRQFIRLDPGCMEPLGQDAADALALFSWARLKPFIQPVSWQLGYSLIIDNWRVLHARGTINICRSNRKLLRCLVS